VNATVTERATMRRRQRTWMDHAVRLGLMSYGVVHLVLAWLAVRLALGDSGGSASGTGAVHEMAQSGIGRVSLYVVGIGLAALVVWQLLEAGWGHHDEDGTKRTFKRLLSVGKAVVYGSLALSALKTAVGASSSSSGGGTKGATAKLMEMPGGPLLVGAVGVAVLVVGGVLAHRGATERFRDNLEFQGQSGHDGRAYVLLGKVGYLAKGLAVAIIGVLFGYAAITHDPDKSGGLDQALRSLLHQPFGAPLLVVTGLGFACFGCFCFAWARHLDR